MLDVIDLGTLLTYQKHIVRMHARYGPQTWLLLYQADNRFRLEHLCRVRRTLAEAHDKAIAAQGTTPFNPDRPWNYSFLQGIKDVEWWNVEFGESAMMLLARTAHMDTFVGGDAPIQPSRVQGARVEAHPDAGDNRLTQQSDRPAKRAKGNAVITNGEYTSNRSGAKLCAEFQTGACGKATHNNKCPKDRTTVHQCAVCLSPEHGKHQCRSDRTPSNDRGRRFTSFKGGKGGKGKSGKGGKYQR